MHPLIKRKRQEIVDVCQRFGVRRLDVFGSASRGTDFEDGRSDVDFLVEFAVNSEAGSSLRGYPGARRT